MSKPDKAAPFTFISCTVERWKSPWLAHQPVMSALSDNHHVLYVLKEPSVDDVLNNLRRRHLPPSGIEKQKSNVYELIPSKFWPRLYASRWADDFFLGRRGAEIDRHLDRLRWDNRILYLWNPHFWRLAGRVRSRLNVFHVHDYYPGFYPAGSAVRIEAERDYQAAIAASDLIVACGESLRDDVIKRGGKNVQLVENGVEFMRLREGVGADLPPEFAGLRRPIVAYVGRINSTVDFGALSSIAGERPDWSVVVLGPKTGWLEANEQRFQSFLRHPNARYVEGKSIGEIGRYINAIDVGLISYQRDGISDHRFPLKMIEYFALGKPVVSIDIPAARQFAPLVETVEGDDQWVPAIEHALKADQSSWKIQRIQAAKERDWHHQSESILQAIERTIEERRNGSDAE